MLVKSIDFAGPLALMVPPASGFYDVMYLTSSPFFTHAWPIIYNL